MPAHRSKRPIVTLLAVLLPIAVVAACSDENRPGTYNGPSQSGNTGILTEGGTSSGEGGGGDATPSEGGVLDCSPLEQLCTPFAAPGTPPGAINGGTLVQGTYILVGSTGNMPCHTLYLADGNVLDVGVTSPATDAGPAISAVRASRFTVSGSGITFEEACPGSGTVSASFGFDGTLLTIEQSGGTRRDVYRKQ